MTALGALATPDVPRGVTVVLALGSLEQHGPHLPLDTDARIATWLVEEIGDQRPALLQAPALPYGASGEHEGATGTISIGTDALCHLLVELGRSVARWADRLLIVNGHGGNLEALTRAVPQLRSERRDVAWWSPRLRGADAHAGCTETSLLRHLAPHLVHLDRLAVGDTRPLDELLPAIRREGGVLAVSPTGVLGDPTTASAQQGARWCDELREQLLDALDAWRPDRTGGLQLPRWGAPPVPATTVDADP